MSRQSRPQKNISRSWNRQNRSMPRKQQRELFINLWKKQLQKPEELMM